MAAACSQCTGIHVGVRAHDRHLQRCPGQEKRGLTQQTPTGPARGTLWQSILTSGVPREGLHRETTPLAWPSCMTAFQGFWRMQSHAPIRVRCCATICPVLVSCAPQGTANDWHFTICRASVPHQAGSFSLSFAPVAAVTVTNVHASGKPSSCRAVHAIQVRTTVLAWQRAHLIPQHATLPDGSQQEVVRQELQPPHACVLLPQVRCAASTTRAATSWRLPLRGLAAGLPHPLKHLVRPACDKPGQEHP